ncbi:hypothetical protein ES703_106100 [subsurface metagenome]
MHLGTILLKYIQFKTCKNVVIRVASSDLRIVTVRNVVAQLIFFFRKGVVIVWILVFFGIRIIGQPVQLQLGEFVISTNCIAGNGLCFDPVLQFPFHRCTDHTCRGLISPAGFLLIHRLINLEA